ncbi:MAG: S8 family peptidase [Lachnospiraceae bacterium]|nr:S8 family peptidase [Lachnospiraceae bacterium]
MDCKTRILSDNYYDIITDYPLRTVDTDRYDLCSVGVDDFYHIVYVNRVGVPELIDDFFDYQNIPKLYGLMQTDRVAAGFEPNVLVASGITQVQRAPLSLTGEGVVVCIIDTGIDYRNPVFLDGAGNSRILSIWDQTVQEGTPPEGFSYGSEYTREQINQALLSENPFSVVPSRDENGHGTAMAGVAAGSNLGGGYTYLGAAPDAELVIVKLKECKPYLRDFYLVPEGVPAYQENDIMLAVAYADSFAQTFRRPVVICLGIGTNMGDHNGSSFLSGYLNSVAIQRSRAVVVCGGNEGNAAHHYHGRLSLENNNRVNVEIRVGESSRGFYLELWGSVPDVFNLTIRSPGGETIPPIRLINRQSITYGFIYERTQITVEGTLVETASGEQVIRFRIQDPTPGIWSFQVAAVGEVYNGEFHMWLPITQFLDTQVYFLESSPYVTLTEPAMARNVISVSTYNSANNSFYTESGRGFDRTGNIRPDLAAPGVNIPTVLGRMSGSSLAAAVTTGAVAQFLQWAVVEGNSPNAQSREIKNYFIRGASRDADLNYPNREWGYGRLDVAGVFDALIGV